MKAYQEKNEIDEDAYRQVAEECRKIIVAADGLLASGNENRPLITEIRPWLIQFKQVGEYGAEVLNMIRLRQQKDAFIGSYEHARALLVLMGETDAQYKAGIKSGSLHLMLLSMLCSKRRQRAIMQRSMPGLIQRLFILPTR